MLDVFLSIFTATDGLQRHLASLHRVPVLMHYYVSDVGVLWQLALLLTPCQIAVLTMWCKNLPAQEAATKRNRHFCILLQGLP